MADGVRAGGKVTIQFSDEGSSGANANIDVFANGHSQSVKDLLSTTDAGKNLIKDGFLSAIMLQAHFDGVTAVVKNNNQEIGTATASKNYVELSSRVKLDHVTINVTRAT